MLVSPQIPLQLEPARRDRFEDFVPGPNQPTVDALRALGEKPGASAFVYGPPSCGKSHILNALCFEHRERRVVAEAHGVESNRPNAGARVARWERRGMRGIGDDRFYTSPSRSALPLAEDLQPGGWRGGVLRKTGPLLFWHPGLGCI